MQHIRKGESKGLWIADHIRAQLEHFFATDPKWKKKSDIGKQNRAAGAGLAAYTGGCRSAGDYYFDMVYI